MKWPSWAEHNYAGKAGRCERNSQPPTTSPPNTSALCNAVLHWLWVELHSNLMYKSDKMKQGHKRHFDILFALVPQVTCWGKASHCHCVMALSRNFVARFPWGGTANSTVTTLVAGGPSGTSQTSRWQQPANHLTAAWWDLKAELPTKPIPNAWPTETVRWYMLNLVTWSSITSTRTESWIWNSRWLPMVTSPFYCLSWLIYKRKNPNSSNLWHFLNIRCTIILCLAQEKKNSNVTASILRCVLMLEM